ncbi:MAG: hypothetical protein OXU45_07175 [Candidatus Melainabacteria bacterium]|nr:hypothetical protein [Candidatus Melainabacteria bacterium]
MMGEDASGKNRDPKPVRLGNNHIIVLENPGDDKVSSHLVEYLDDQNIVVT